MRRASVRSPACSAASRSPRRRSRTRASCWKGRERGRMRQWRIGAAPAGAEIEDVAGLLRGAGIVLLPTDTIYGLHAAAIDANAVDRLAQIKGRDDLKPFVVI